MEMLDCPVRPQPGIEGGQDVTLDTALLSQAGIAASVLTIHRYLYLQVTMSMGDA